jgi:5'-deoxynucleotidase YfbR-like HD superfamily hydrolase
MLSGRRLDLLDPSPLDVEITDIAHGLARVSRWNGQTHGDHAFSVAQHCLVVEDIFCCIARDISPECRLAALLHDAPEYVIGDMISPFKAVVGGGYKAVERRLQRAIHLRFVLAADLAEGLRKTIKRADRIAAFFEATQLAGFSDPEAARFFGRPRGFSAEGLDLKPKSAKTVQQAFLTRFDEIERLREAGSPTTAPTAPGDRETTASAGSRLRPSRQHPRSRGRDWDCR